MPAGGCLVPSGLRGTFFRPWSVELDRCAFAVLHERAFLLEETQIHLGIVALSSQCDGALPTPDEALAFTRGWFSPLSAAVPFSGHAPSTHGSPSSWSLALRFLPFLFP